MKRIFLILGLCLSLAAIQAAEKRTARLVLDAPTLMHEMRMTPSPLDGAAVSERFVSFQWPMESYGPVRSGLDGTEDKVKKINKSNLRYMVRYSTDAALKKDVKSAETVWPFYNPEERLKAGKWYWQYGYVHGSQVTWSEVLSFTVGENPDCFCPPSFKEFSAGIPAEHPRVWMDKDKWDQIIERSEGTPEAEKYISTADKALKNPMKSVSDIKSGMAAGLKNDSQRKAMMTRESRRVIDAEERNVDALVRAYLLTKDRRYADEALDRALTMASWSNEGNVVGDFNRATFLSVCSLVYDSLYEILDKDSKGLLLAYIKDFAGGMYDGYNNHLEEHIADNHVWQMNLRILTMAVMAVYGELPEARLWAEYCYNVWLARFPGLNRDGAWHNGDSYFQVNMRTLVEVPYLYTRWTGFNYFSDPWYAGNAMYTIYQQPVFSHAGGNGSSHQAKVTTSGVRVGYADAIAKMTGNSYLADYVRSHLKTKPKMLNEGCTDKGSGLAWFRILCDKELPEGPGLKDLPFGHVFPQSGLASFSTRLDKHVRSAMISFRSSPYGSTSHAVANQNAFNTFWHGEALFYSSGHHTSFIDNFSLLCERSTRAHNTILVNGIGQRIGTEGYGWIPRHYVGKKIGYVLGDASNAYGKVISPLWKKRAEECEVEFSPENGWDDVPLTTYRRHIVELGKTGYTFIYDELEAAEPVEWSYLLHTVTNPMIVEEGKDCVHVRATSRHGESDAYIYSTGKLAVETTDRFFVPAENWLKADANGNFKQDPDHWHFTAKSEKSKVYRFATIINTQEKPGEDGKPAVKPVPRKDGSIKMGSWIIKCNLSSEGEPSFNVYNGKEGEDTGIRFSGKATVVREDGAETRLIDEFPELEI